MDEPKAWLYICDGDEKHPVITHTKQSWPNHEGGWWKEVPLYAQREWAGLNDDDYKVLREGVVKQGKPIAWMIEQIEEKLKEKNT